jgi:UDP-N-acetylglucosamine transferase subunit ALG13
MKIFVSVGTHEIGFLRLLKLVSKIESHDLTVQFGSSAFTNSSISANKCFDFCSYDEMVNHAIDSDVIVGSASPGLANLAWEYGCVYIGMPRLHKYDEAVDDHQVDFVLHLVNLGGCIHLKPGDDLNAILEAIESDKNSILEKQKICQKIFNKRIESVRKSVVDFLLQ